MSGVECLDLTKPEKMTLEFCVDLTIADAGAKGFCVDLTIEEPDPKKMKIMSHVLIHFAMCIDMRWGGLG